MSNKVHHYQDKRSDSLDLQLLASIVHNCIQEDKLSKLRATLKKFTREQRQKIVSEKINGNAPLFTACFQGKVYFANYILEECGADVELRGIYEVEEDHSRHEVTPLWCASVANKLEVVKTLVVHGADVNSPSDTESTPVRSACYMTNIPIIKYLVDHGANIHKPNVNGGTCLINSVQSSELCEFLINRGASVNSKDNSGNLALHYAIREGRTDTVKLLLSHGSDHTSRNDFGDDALQTAALRGYQDIVQIIIEQTTQSKLDQIRAYELLGTNFVDEKNDMIAALAIWKKAMQIRYTDKTAPLLKELPEQTTYVYRNVKEPNSLEELEELIDPEEIHMQTLLIRERILGKHHKDTTFGLMYRGAVYADSHRFQRCVDLWKYAYTLRHEKKDPMNPECLFSVQALVKLFWEIQVEVESGASDENVAIKDALDVFMILSEQITNSAKPNGADQQTTTTNDFQLLLQLLLHLIHLISRLEMTDEANINFRRQVHQLVVLDPRGTSGESLLHLAVDPKISLTSEEFYSPFPSLSVIKILVECGANVNSLDGQRNTPLYNGAMFLNYSDLQDGGILSYLLEVGAHVDICNNHGSSALSLMESQGFPLCRMTYISLKCLASNVIIKNKLPYKQEIPVSLVPFVELHGVAQNRFTL